MSENWMVPLTISINSSICSYIVLFLNSRDDAYNFVSHITRFFRVFLQYLSIQLVLITYNGLGSNRGSTQMLVSCDSDSCKILHLIIIYANILGGKWQQTSSSDDSSSSSDDELSSARISSILTKRLIRWCSFVGKIGTASVSFISLWNFNNNFFWFNCLILADVWMNRNEVRWRLVIDQTFLLFGIINRLATPRRLQLNVIIYNFPTLQCS